MPKLFFGRSLAPSDPSTSHRVSRFMPEDSGRWIILFDSIHHVLAAEELFKERGLWCDLTPVPRDLSSNCGMAIEFRTADLEAVHSLLRDLSVRPRSIHRPGTGGHVDVTDAVF